MPEIAHGRDVRRVYADERTSGQGTVQLTLRSCNARSRVSSGGGESQHAGIARLDSLIGRRDLTLPGREHKRGPFRVQVAVRVLDESESGADVRECEGHIGGGSKENFGHVVCPFETGGALVPLNCLYNTKEIGISLGHYRARLTRRGRARTGDHSRGVGAVVSRHRHTSIVPEKFAFVSGIILPGCMPRRAVGGMLAGRKRMLAGRKRLLRGAAELRVP